MLCALFANAHRGRNQQPFKLKDFLLYTQPEKKEQSLMDQRAILISLALSSGGKVVDKKTGKVLQGPVR